MANSAASETTMAYEIAQSQRTPSEWIVEAIGPDGEVYVTVFAGPAARERAAEYAGWKNEG